MTDFDESIETIKFCGIEWKNNEGNKKFSMNPDLIAFTGYLSDDKIGSLFITENAFRILNNNVNFHYKVISLIYELRSLGKCFSIGENDKDLLRGPISNDDYVSCTVDDFLKRFPDNFVEIQRRSLLTLFRNYPNYGQIIKNVEEYEFFAKDNTELGFIIESLISKNFLKGGVSWSGIGSAIFKAPFSIKVDGWQEIEKSLHTVYSNRVFIAMSFDEALKPVQEKIKQAIKDARLDPVIMHEVEHVKFIPLEIQNQIRNCGFMVADFTTQNHGAYFEAGFAMGQDIQVIWCCRKDDEKNLHFDIRQYNNILWDNVDDLYNRLFKRLKALKGETE